ncbi:fungal-specific transcription factor domain-containing protein [Chytriomyces sp. MP71]|nr:fungal-specific transcription factor domain-containing protein [Chytriomyces sp. MP71]
MPCSGCSTRPNLCVYAPALKKKENADEGESKLDRIEQRLSQIEQILGNLVPILDHLVPSHLKQGTSLSTVSPPIESFSTLHTAKSTKSNSPVLAFKRPLEGAPSAHLHTPQITSSSSLLSPTVPSSSKRNQAEDSSYKSGGFLINTEETALTFWGSTSALGGKTHNAHLYRAIPRFINGILMVHIPARTAQECAKEVSETPRSDYSSPKVFRGQSNPPSERDPYQEKGLYEPKESSATTSIQSLVDDRVELRELIPLEDDLVDHILKNFWEQFHPQFPLIDKLWFIGQFARLRRQSMISVEENWRFILLLTSVITLMLNFTPSLSHWRVTKSAEAERNSGTKLEETTDAEFEEHDTALRLLTDSYKKIFFDHFEIADVIVVQSLLFMVLTGGCSRGSRFTGTWGYMGIAVRLAQELGLHRSIKELGVQHKTFNKETIAVRNRTWHCVMILETYTGIWTGRPLAIHDNDWDAEYPEVTSPELADLHHHFELAQIIASILRFANRARPADASAFQRDVTIRLDAWCSRLDPEWKAGRFAERWNAKALMSLMYHSAVILFHRTAYGHTDATTCMDAAAAISHLVARFEAPLRANEVVALFPTFTYCAMQASSVHIGTMLVACTGARKDTTAFVGAVGRLEKCMRVFDNLRGIFVAAERCWKTVLDFLTARGIKLDELFRAASQEVGGRGTVECIMSGVGRAVGSGTEAPMGTPASAETPKVGNGNGAVSALWSQGGLSNMNSGLVSALFGTEVAESGMNAVSLTSPQKLQLQQLGALSSSAATNGLHALGTVGGAGDADLGLWDGLSLFDLAGLGGLGNVDFGLFGAHLAGATVPQAISQLHPSQPAIRLPTFQNHQNNGNSVVFGRKSTEVASYASSLHQLAELSATSTSGASQQLGPHFRSSPTLLIPPYQFAQPPPRPPPFPQSPQTVGGYQTDFTKLGPVQNSNVRNVR